MRKLKRIKVEFEGIPLEIKLRKYESKEGRTYWYYQHPMKIEAKDYWVQIRFVDMKTDRQKNTE